MARRLFPRCGLYQSPANTNDTSTPTEEEVWQALGSGPGFDNATWWIEDGNIKPRVLQDGADAPSALVGTRQAHAKGIPRMCGLYWHP